LVDKRGKTQSRNGAGTADRKIEDREMGSLFLFLSSIFLSAVPAPLRLCRAAALRFAPFVNQPDKQGMLNLERAVD
jgi:hypothetical protein